MMSQGKFTVIDCPACDDLHPVYFDEATGIDGDTVYDCPVAGQRSVEVENSLRVVVSVGPEREP
jgi:hypothetical protein